jgi:hypothetical protein
MKAAAGKGRFSLVNYRIAFEKLIEICRVQNNFSRRSPRTCEWKFQ